MNFNIFCKKKENIEKNYEPTPGIVNKINLYSHSYKLPINIQVKDINNISLNFIFDKLGEYYKWDETFILTLKIINSSFQCNSIFLNLAQHYNWECLND